MTARAATVGNPTQLLIELRLNTATAATKVVTKSERPDVAPFVFDTITKLLQ